MISRRDKLLNHPWTMQRYEHHREKLRSAKPTVDMRSPPVYTHIKENLKKTQKEKERLKRIEEENIRLLQKLGGIMRTKRLENFWIAPRPNFLNREKLFDVRPQTSLPRLVAIYLPQSSGELVKSKHPILKSPKSLIARRCPTCSGRPEYTEVSIPEKRIPWEPERKSWNVRASSESAPKRCMHCGHSKRS